MRVPLFSAVPGITALQGAHLRLLRVVQLARTALASLPPPSRALQAITVQGPSSPALVDSAALATTAVGAHSLPRQVLVRPVVGVLQGTTAPRGVWRKCRAHSARTIPRTEPTAFSHA
jgi:hypothetical protein